MLQNYLFLLRQNTCWAMPANELMQLLRHSFVVESYTQATKKSAKIAIIAIDEPNCVR
jgi:hypothetical protein